MLTGEEIIRRVKSGDIIITNFDENKVNPNSYNLTLNKHMIQYALKETIETYYDSRIKVYPVNGVEYLDCKMPNPTIEYDIPDEGLVLFPGVLYLGSTNEYTECKDLIPCIDGRSSIGRLGIQIHATAGFGDVGFKGKWTLEITVVHPVKIYPNMELCQIYFTEPVGTTGIQYKGKYQNQDSAIASKLFSEMKNS